MKALIISGLLYKLSDNIIPFLDKDTDVFVHTWDMNWNGRWLVKLNRYKKYCNDIRVVSEKPFLDKKLYSYFYSTWKVVNLIKDIDKYSKIIKFKPNVEGDINFVGDIEYYYTKAKIQSRPLLDNITIENSIFGTIHYVTLDERMFTAKPPALKKAFKIPEEEFLDKVYQLDTELTSRFGTENYEGSIFWTKWFESRGLYPILDIDLKIPNCIPYGNN